jgi:NAD(P)H-dependent FMN reductase
MNVIAFAASNNRQSINRLLASYTANLMDGAKIELL